MDVAVSGELDAQVIALVLAELGPSRLRPRRRLPILMVADLGAGTRLLADVVREAIETRMEDPEYPQAFFSLREPLRTPSDPYELAEAVGKALQSSEVASTIRGVARDAVQLDPRLGSSGLRAIDVLAAIHLKWCNIWPFCRPTGRPSDDEPSGLR